MTPEQKRYFWGTLAFLTTILVAAMLALLAASCTKSKTEQHAPATVQVDTTRQRLQRQVNQAKTRAGQAHQRTSLTEKPHETASKTLDSLGDELLLQLGADSTRSH